MTCLKETIKAASHRFQQERSKFPGASSYFKGNAQMRTGPQSQQSPQQGQAQNPQCQRNPHCKANTFSIVAQAVLHRELLHVHASLAHIHTILHQPLALRSTPLLDRVTRPHLRAQLEGLLALRINHTAIHYTHELLTALGLLHIVHHSPEQLEAELQGRTDFGDRFDYYRSRHSHLCRPASALLSS